MEADGVVGDLAARAARIVQGHLGRAVRLHDPIPVARRPRSLVARCAVEGWEGVASVILKQNLGDDARGCTDWAALAFLSSLERAAPIAPRFYAGAVAERILVMEDLGGSSSLEDVLNDPHGAVVDVLQALAVTMARLVAATAGGDESFGRLRAGLPGAAGLGREQEAARWLEARPRVERWADALGATLPAGFDAACAHVARRYAAPGPWLALSHGDPAPSNNHVAPDGVRLLDFEYAAYRHALYDLTAWEILCPLAPAWVAAMERSFKETLAPTPVGALVGDERLYAEERAAMCAYRALALLTWLSPEVLEQDRGWTPEWTQRQAVISTVLRLHRATAGSAALAPLAALGADLAARARARWPERGDGALRWPAAGS